jgi:hypothetical protein
MCSVQAPARMCSRQLKPDQSSQENTLGQKPRVFSWQGLVDVFQTQIIEEMLARQDAWLNKGEMETIEGLYED